MNTPKSACKAKNPEFCRYHSTGNDFNQRIENSYNVWKEKAENAQTLDERYENEQILEEIATEYASTDAGREMFAKQYEESTDDMEKERLQQLLEEGERLRDYIESKADGVIRFPISKLEDAQDRIEKANRKLARAGLEQRFTYTTEEYVEYDKDGHAFSMVALSLSHPSLSVSGWTFKGAVDKTEDGNVVVRSAPSQELHGYRPDVFKCDHCGSNRRRNSTYLLQNEEGEYKQVGSNCLQSFLGVKPAGLWTLDYDPEAGDEFLDRGSRVWGSADSAIPTVELVAAALAVSDNGEKYVSKSSAYEWGGESTVGAVTNYFFSNNRDRWKDTDHSEYMEAARELVQNTKFEGDDDYNTNMRTLLAQDHTSMKHMGYVTSVIAARKRQEREAEKQARKDKPKAVGFLGEPKEKVTNLPVKLIHKASATNYYNGVERSSTMFLMEDAQGRQIKWWATNAPEAEVGAEFTIKSATIKMQDTYNGNDQTVILRAKLEGLE